VTVPVPPVIPGDPAGMRNFAGDRLRSRMRSVTGELDGVVSGLADVAGELERAADEVEASQRAHDAAVQENAREAQLQVG
jgi:hypothetical protein